MIIISQGLRQQQDVLKQTLQDNGLLLPFQETEVSGMCFHSEHHCRVLIVFCTLP